MSPDEAQEERRRPVVEVAPAPVPTELPLAGPDGVDGAGAPRRYVDRPGLRSLLWRERWEDLDRYFDAYQKAFEDDPKHELWPLDAAGAFASAEGSLTKKLNRWVKARPGSWAAQLARGTHWVAVGFANRGGKVVADTPSSDMVDMKRAFDNVRLDLDAALAARPKLLPVLNSYIQIAAAGGTRGEVRAAVDRALSLCPSCFQVRVTFILYSRPRWGGSHDEMRAFAKGCDPRQNARCPALEGFVDFDVAVGAREHKDLDAAARAIDRALAFGECAEFYDERALIRERKEDHAGALADAERAVALRPASPDVRVRRARALFELQRWEEAGRDLLAALRVEPTDREAKLIAPDVVNGLVYAGWQEHKAGRREAVLRILDLAAELAPSERKVLSRRAAAILGSETPDIAMLEEAVRKAPDDLRLLQQLDYALAKQGRFERAVELWTEYIGRHPDEGRAYLERGGAYFHLRKRDESRADAARACDLGITEGCVRAK
jgi:tetratricopeptide (TPR) repeat protein